MDDMQIRNRTKQLIEGIYETIEKIKPIFIFVDEATGYPVAELVHKSTMAVAALMLKVDGEIKSIEYEEYKVLCNRVNVNPLKIDMIKRLEDREVISLFTESMKEIVRVLSYNSIPNGIKEPIGKYIKQLLAPILFRDEVCAEEEIRLQEEIYAITNIFFGLEE